MGVGASLKSGFLTHRTRIARLVVVVGVLVIAAQFLPVVPRDVELRYDLGPGHASVSGLELVYQAGDEDLTAVQFNFGEAGPRLLEHRVELAPGHYDVRATLNTSSGKQRFIRHFEAPAEGVVHVELFDVALAHAEASSGALLAAGCRASPLNPTLCQTSLAWHLLGTPTGR